MSKNAAKITVSEYSIKLLYIQMVIIIYINYLTIWVNQIQWYLDNRRPVIEYPPITGQNFGRLSKRAGYRVGRLSGHDYSIPR